MPTVFRTPAANDGPSRGGRELAHDEEACDQALGVDEPGAQGGSPIHGPSDRGAGEGKRQAEKQEQLAITDVEGPDHQVKEEFAATTVSVMSSIENDLTTANECNSRRISLTVGRPSRGRTQPAWS